MAEAYRNLSAVGATPIAITDNLNFGNPEKPATMGYIVKAIEGMAEACRDLDFPVVSGNVSLYNETDGVAIPPTPVVGGVGLIEDVSKIATLKGAQEGDVLILIGETKGHLGASLYAREWLGLKGEELGPPPPVDLATEMKNAAFVRKLIEEGLVNAVHDVSDGGIACAAVEMSLAAGMGFSIVDTPRDVSFHFGERPGSYLVSLTPGQENRDAFDRAAANAGIEWSIYANSMGSDQLMFTQYQGGAAQRFSEENRPKVEWQSSISLDTLRDAHEGWLPRYMQGE